MEVLDALRKSKDVILKNPHYVAYAAVFDFLLYAGMGLVSVPLASKSGEALTVWLGSQGEQELVLSQLITGDLAVFLGWFVLMLVVLYGVYCLTQGMAWYFASLTLKKNEAKYYMKRFFKASLPYAILYFLLQVIAYIGDYMVLNGFPLPEWVPYAYDFWVIAILYFAGINYTQIRLGFGKNLKLGLKHFKMLLPSVILLYMVARAINIGLIFFLSDSVVSIVLTGIVMLAWIGWTRMVWMVLNV